MRNTILITVIGTGLAVGVAYGKPVSKNPEVAEFQKLEMIVNERYKTGVSSQDQLLKARILEKRALYVNGELAQDKWLAYEQKLNADLLKLQTALLSQGKNSIDQIFEFQNWLLSTRGMLKRTPGASKPSAGAG
jgi:hypothetical protein